MRTKDDIKDYKIYMETHDFGFLLPGLSEILRYKSIYPDFKISCFTVPLPQEFFLQENIKHFSVDKYKKWAEVINGYDWMEIGIHGFAHTKNEADIGYDKMVELLKAGENLFKKVGLNYKKMFVAPYWQYSYDALMALRDNGWAVGLNRDNPVPRPKDLKYFFYTWNINEPVLPSNKQVVAHSHTTSRGVENGLAQAYNNFINVVPKEAEFGLLSDYIEEQYAKEQSYEDYAQSQTPGEGGSRSDG